MECKHITEEQYTTIRVIAGCYADLTRGKRRKQEVKAQMTIELLSKYATDCKKMPESYTIVYTRTRNLGNATYPYVITDVDTFNIGKKFMFWNVGNKRMRETEKSVIVEREWQGVWVKEITIPKSKIVCCVW